jgi:hypothetical protein
LFCRDCGTAGGSFALFCSLSLRKRCRRKLQARV